MQLNNRQVLHGDVLEKIKEIPDNSIDCIITSPPYWGLRDYGVKGQIGLEPDYKSFLKIMRKVMDECKRVLKDTGTCWINLGDTYASGGGKGVEQTISNNNGVKKEQDYSPKSKWRKTMAKSRFGIPERFYIQCIDDGWIARNHIPWVKANPMPSSVKDRFTNKWEAIFFFSKNQKYYFNMNNSEFTTQQSLLSTNEKLKLKNLIDKFVNALSSKNLAGGLQWND